LAVVRINSLDYTGVCMRVCSRWKVIIVDGPSKLLLVSDMYPLVLVQLSHLILLIIELLLQKTPVLRETHVCVLEWESLHLVLQIGLLNIVVRQLINELVEVFSAVLVSQVLVFA
jgi:hypothetical protein